MPAKLRGNAKAQRDGAIVAAYEAGSTQAAVAQHFGLSRSFVSKVLERAGVTSLYGESFATRNKDIVAAYQGGLERAEVAEQFGLSATRIGEILDAKGVVDQPERIQQAKRQAAAKAAATWAARRKPKIETERRPRGQPSGYRPGVSEKHLGWAEQRRAGATLMAIAAQAGVRHQTVAAALKRIEELQAVRAALKTLPADTPGSARSD